MFRCNNCGTVVPPKTACKKVVTAWRIRHYPERRADPKRGIVIHRPIAYTDEKGKRKLRYPSDPGGVGREIAQEAEFCPRCAAEYDRQQRELQGILV